MRVLFMEASGRFQLLFGRQVLAHSTANTSRQSAYTLPGDTCR